MQLETMDLLRQESARWWYHAQLRRQGQHAEADRLEERSVQQSAEHILRALTSGGWITVSQDGGRWTLHMAPGSTLQGYGTQDTELFLQACILEGVPLLDLRTVPFDVAWDISVKGAMSVCEAEAAQESGQDRWAGTMFAKVCWREKLPQWKGAGATCVNC
jgi:hypothetical protein